jgi:GNAT superfamily N-acetyltransferase
MERIEVFVAVGVPHDAARLAWIKFDNLVYRVNAGKLPMSPEEVARKRPTETSIQALSELLEASGVAEYHLIAKSESDIVGYCRMSWRSDSRQFQFQQFYVDPKFMGKKIGGQIVAAAKERARRSPLSPKGIFLYTGDYNNDAQAMYEHWGFRHARPEEFSQRVGGRQDVEWQKMVLDF